MSYGYISLGAAKAEVGKQAADSDKDALIQQHIFTVTERIHQYPQVHMEFAPRRATFTYDTGNRDVYLRGALMLNYPLLEIISITVGGVALTDYTIIRDTPWAPIWQLYNNAIGHSTVAITGIWGYRSHYDEAWAGSIALAGSPDASATTLTANSTPTGVYVGCLLKNDDEYLLCTALDGTTITVQRGVRGTTATAISNPLTIWQPQPVVAYAATRWVAALTSKPAGFSQANSDRNNRKAPYPADAPEDVHNILMQYRRWTGVTG